MLIILILSVNNKNALVNLTIIKFKHYLIDVNFNYVMKYS